MTEFPDYSTYITERTRDFVGREWVFQAIDAWLADGQQHSFLLTGGPGSGKSTLAARLVQMSREEVSSEGYPHLTLGGTIFPWFCQAANDPTLDPLRFVRALSLHLADQHPAFAEALTQVGVQEPEIKIHQEVGTAAPGAEVTALLIQELHIGNLSARVAFERVVRRPLEALYESGFDGTLLILVDGLDEALTYDPDENLVVLLGDVTDNSRDLPAGVHLLLTSRPDERVHHRLGPATLDLIADAPVDVDDVRAYAYRRLGAFDEPRRSQLADRIAAAGKGNFLYARYVIDELPPDIAAVDDLPLPEDLNDQYRQFLAREVGRERREWRERTGPLFGLLAVARGDGLTARHLAGITGLRRSEIDGLLDVLQQYLVGPLPQGPFRFYHRSFRDFLLEDESYPIYPNEASQDVAAYFLEEYSGAWLECEDRYALANTSGHLLEAARLVEGRRERNELLERLVTLLTDLEFLEAKTRQLGIDGVLADLRAALGATPVEGETPSGLAAIYEVLDREAHILRAWDLRQYPLLFVQQVHKRAVDLGYARLADQAGARLAQTGRPQMLLQWRARAESAALKRTLSGHSDWVNAVAATPDGQLIVSGGAEGVVKVWEVRTGRELRAFSGHKGRVTSVAITPHGRHAVSASRDGSLVVWDLQSGRQVRRLSGHEQGVRSVAITPDGRYALSGSYDQTVRVWELESGETKVVFSGHTGRVRDVTTASRNRWALSASDDRTLRIWDWETGEEIKRLGGHRRGVDSVAVTPDGRRALSGDREGALILWDLESAEIIWRIDAHTDRVEGIAITPDGRHAVSGGRDARIRIWDLATGEQIHTLVGHGHWVRDVTVTPDGGRVISASGDHTLKVWALQTDEPPAAVVTHADRVSAVAVVPDGRAGLTGSADRSIKAWDLRTGQPLATLVGHAERVNDLAISADGQRAISTSDDGFVKVWDLVSFQELTTLEGHRDKVRAAALTPDGSQALTASYDRNLILWDLETGTQLKTLEGHTGGVRAVAATPDGSRAISGSFDRELVVWNLETGRPSARWEAHADWVNGLAVTADGTRAVSISADGSMRVWNLDLQRDEPLQSVRLGNGVPRGLALTTDGAKAITAADNQAIQVWDLASGELLSTVVLEEIVLSVDVTADGATILCGDRAGNAYCLRFLEA